MNVCFETFGCRLNRAEALEDEAKCLAVGHKVVTDHDEADFFVIRGCSVTSRAQRDCEKLIAHLREKYPTKRIHLTGCLKEARPFIVKQKGDVPPVPMSTARAYLKAQNGCNGECTFCIVPRFRGKNVSDDFTTVVDKAKRFIDAGYHEIVLTGCNLSLYASGGKRLPDLVSALAELDPACRIRIGSLEPFLSAEETIDAMAGHGNVCRFLHMPVQSGSNRILTAMKRPYTVETAEQLMQKAKRLMPFIALGCDMIAGFPGETERDHLASETLLTRLKIVNVHSFPFSRRPGTPAATMAGQLPHEEVVERARKIAKIGETNRRAFARQFVDKTVEVVIESEKHAVGWTSEYLWFEEQNATSDTSETKNERRETVLFRVKEAHGGRLYGVRA